MKTAVFIVLLVFSSLNVFAQKDAARIFISPHGNDDWTGRLPDINSTKTDGPFKTFDRAKSEVEKLVKNNKKGIIVSVRGGNYDFTNYTLALTQLHSGKKDAPVTWKNYNNEKVQITGGKNITGFKTISDTAVLNRLDAAAAKHIYVTDLKAQGIREYGKITNRGRPGVELFFDGKKMTLARWPDSGFDSVAYVPQYGTLQKEGMSDRMTHGIPKGRHYGKIAYNGNRPSRWTNVDDIYLYGYWVWDWHDEFQSVEKIDTTQKEITIAKPYSYYGFHEGQRYYALNILEELDRPGEWYIDRSKGLLYFWPPNPITKSNVYLSLSDQTLLTLKNTSFVNVEGFEFSYSRGNAISVNGGNNNLVAGCAFTNLGDIPVLIESGKKNGIKSCNIYNVAAGGVVLNGGVRETLEPGGNFAINNHIHHFGQWIKTHQSAITVNGVGNYIANNLIHNGPNSGITMTGNEHLVEYNELHHLGEETADVGAFYMGRDWTQRGNIVRYNYFHDLNGPGQNYVNGVYLDDFTSGVHIEGNIFARSSKGIEIGGGRDNTVINNLFLDNNMSISVDARGMTWGYYYFNGEDNTLQNLMAKYKYDQPPYSVKYPVLKKLYNDEPAFPKGNIISNNIHINGEWIHFYDNLTLKAIESKNNVVVNPKNDFKNADDLVLFNQSSLIKEGNSGLTLDSKILSKGFKPLPFSKMGLYNDAYRKDAEKPFK